MNKEKQFRELIEISDPKVVKYRKNFLVKISDPNLT